MNKILASKKAREQGFSLVELVVVIAIIGILVSIAVVYFRNVQQDARISSAKSDLVNSAKALEVFRAENDRYPSTVPAELGSVLKSTITKSNYDDNPANFHYCVSDDGDSYGITTLLRIDGTFKTYWQSSKYGLNENRISTAGVQNCNTMGVGIDEANEPEGFTSRWVKRSTLWAF